MEDEELVRRYRSGDAEAFSLLIDRYTGKAMALAVQLMRNREEAEDVCQEAFLRTFVHLDKFDATRCFRTWFFTLLGNVGRDRLRRSRRFGRFTRRFQSDIVSRRPARPPERSADHLDERILDHLSRRQRIAVWLWAYEGCTGVEIASVLGCAPGTARVHLYAARKKIKKYLERDNAAM